MSSTYDPLKCNVDCICDKENMQCLYERQYAEMSSSSGLLGVDFISFGKESALKPQRATFGCETSESGDLFNQHADGIMGLGRGQLSIMDQLVDKGVISDSFSLCYGGMDIGGGAMVLGGISSPHGMIYAHSNPGRRYSKSSVLAVFWDGNSPYYNIDLKEIHVAGKPLRLNSKIFNGNHGTVLDSGTTYTYLPEEAFRAFRDAVNLVHLTGIVVRNTLVTYDRQNERIGFWKTNCSVLWERLHNNEAPAPAPSVFSGSNLSIEESPAPSPIGLVDSVLAGLSWWKQHLVAVAIGVSVLLLLSFSTFLVWYMRRWRIKGPGAYRTVDDAVPEQELQPM
ncbi:hypothetical protein GW17_00044903 [Ensete ventricosum]|uniref:Uncharacterized protein n=1 Tax=Ensete ventricosum TaxID=4639 RepID=A0A444D3H9_ENSVE|nr:hypothetical protein GW17_00044903 [Ensete ventricosum]RZR74515.1 hypothetical protein BHM03_00037865 [Ensete ventricosum]